MAGTLVINRAFNVLYTVYGEVMGLLNFAGFVGMKIHQQPK